MDKIENALEKSVRPIFNKEGPAMVNYTTYKTWLIEYLTVNALQLDRNHSHEKMRKETRKNLTPAGIPKSFLRQQTDE